MVKELTKTPKKKIPRVMLLIETSREYARGLLKGIAAWNHKHGPWSFQFQPLGLTQLPSGWLSQWNGDGILVRIDNRKMERAVLATGIPAIDLRGALANPEIHFLGVDNFKIAKLAFEHLHERGFRHYAFCGLPSGLNRFDDERRRFFSQLVEEAGFSCSIFPADKISDRGNRLDNERKAIARWLRSLPIPTGLMACKDDRGLQVVDAALLAGRRIPDDLAIISVDNDPYFCGMGTPTITSISTNSERIGYRAAGMLARLMKGHKNVPKYSLVPPGQVFKRTSTDILAVDNPVDAEILRFLREQALDGLSVEQVIRQLDISRSTAERVIKKYVGRTPKAEMIRIRVEHSKCLLKQTSLPLSVIAKQSGFCSTSYFIASFSKQVGMSPARFRQSEAMDQAIENEDDIT